MSSSQPLISVIIPTHNRAVLLQRALNSVVGQRYKNLELIIVDDSSKDNTEDIVKNYQDRVKITYIKNDVAVGACAARNIGINAAEGVFIAGLDDDDTWHPDRVFELHANYSSEYAFVTSDVLIMKDKTQHVWRKKSVLTLNDLLYSNQVGNQVLVEKERVLEVGGFDENLTAAQDYDLWIRLCSKYGPIRNVQKVLQTVYEEESRDRITTSYSKKIDGYLRFYNKHKSKMDIKQRKYQLYLMRRKLYKRLTVKEFFNYIPVSRYLKEAKRILRSKID